MLDFPALRTVWHGQNFDVVYADFCYANPELIQAGLMPLFDDDRLRRRSRELIYTITKRTEGCLDGRLAACTSSCFFGATGPPSRVSKRRGRLLGPVGL